MGIGALLADAIHAQVPARSGPTFTAQTELVSVSVIVTDKSGVHIHGLKKEDFSILEDGVEQKVSVCDEIRPDHYPHAAVHAPDSAAVRRIAGCKTLVWAGGGFPFSINETTMALKEGSVGMDTPANLEPMYERTWETLNRAQISVYAVDVHGLGDLPDWDKARALKPLPDPIAHDQWLHAGHEQHAGSLRSCDCRSRLCQSERLANGDPGSCSRQFQLLLPRLLPSAGGQTQWLAKVVGEG